MGCKDVRIGKSEFVSKTQFLCSNIFHVYDAFVLYHLFVQDLRSKFDEVVESCETGMRKPDVEIYRHTLEKLKMAEGDVVFLDDIDSNIVGAEQLGIQSIKVG